MSATAGDEARAQAPTARAGAPAAADDEATDRPAASERPAPLEETTPARPPRIYRGELTSALGALGLLVLMFLTKWYGVAGVPDPSAARPAISTAENAWNGLTIVRWIMLLTIVAALGSVVLHASQRSHGMRTDTSRVVFGLGSLTSVLLIYRVLIDLPQADRVIDQKLGAVLGLMCALGIAIGGFESMREQRILAKAISQHPRHRNRGEANGTSPGQTKAPDASA
jgi:hypothetical protein